MKNWSIRKRTIFINVLLFVVLFLLIDFNKSQIRPLVNKMPIANELAGCFPNFIAALLISLALINAIRSKSFKASRFVSWGAALLVFIILTLEEFVPMWGASTHFDLLDIIASGLGAALAILIFELLNGQSAKKEK
ncbi:MAG: hypothetical protein JW729_04640 [Bacteroidales bacterium]|nr:hypothetical protein [Bacteroidales bacterium]